MPALVAVTILAALSATPTLPSTAAKQRPPSAADAASRRQRLERFAASVPAPSTLPSTNFAACVSGDAGGFACLNVDLMKHLALPDVGGGNSGNGCWGWVDPLSGREYAIFGRSNGTSFVDITDASNPVFLGDLPTHSADSLWRDIKVYADHAFVVSEAAGHGMQVFDLARLRAVPAPPATFTEDAWYGDFSNAHTIALNEETGFAYATGTNTCAGGLHMIDVRSPLAPTFAGCFDQDGYTHETQCISYRGPDLAHRGREICFACNEDTLTVVDVTDKLFPVMLSRTGYPESGYTHQGWLTEDQRHFLLDDEFDEFNVPSNTRTIRWDVSDLDAPVYQGFYLGPNASIDHNLYIRGRRAYLSNYTSGLRILDLACIDGGDLREVGYFDTFPPDNAASFTSAWSNYPFFPSGNVLISCIGEGLFIVRPWEIELPPVAIAPGLTVCEGELATLDGSLSTPCSPAGLIYRWLEGDSEVCTPSPTPTCEVFPTATTTYTLEVTCADQQGCVDRAPVTVVVSPLLAADAGPDVASCAGTIVTLDGSASAACPTGATAYRWLDGTFVVCPWSSSPTCDVSPPVTTAFTLAVACDSSRSCDATDTTTVLVDPDLMPDDLGNSLKAAERGFNVAMIWGSTPLARSYSLYRSGTKGAWAAQPADENLATPGDVVADLLAAPTLLYYRAAGASCSGLEGP